MRLSSQVIVVFIELAIRTTHDTAIQKKSLINWHCENHTNYCHFLKNTPIYNLLMVAFGYLNIKYKKSKWNRNILLVTLLLSMEKQPTVSLSQTCKRVITMTTIIFCCRWFWGLNWGPVHAKWVLCRSATAPAQWYYYQTFVNSWLHSPKQSFS